ncbi:MAG: hypothetical protein Q4C89_13980 [Deinococcus sp.]|uniref:hypothetical protein n=1 Tax=Deinococcus sp. TaxID=47478 RepID=UPI0026DC0556|nr:hypothetical protein [Deinococcus sp.]MDO4247123.1 hypothetical protein [Deinococcus sp.]
MMTTMPKTRPTAAHQRRLASIWRVGMVLLVIGMVTDSLGEVWDSLRTQGWNWNQLNGLGVAALVGGACGIGLTLYAATQFQKGPQPRFTVYGVNKGMDEREVTRLLEAQAKAQQFFARCLMGVALLGGVWGADGVHLSWWSCLLGLAFLLNAVVYLPVSILVAGEKDLEDEE